TPAELDKEGFRRWLAGKGYTGDGEPPAIPEDLRVETALRYVEAFETITGEVFEPSPLAAQALDEILAEWARAV
ncbi:MAG TPA: phosphoribosylaminoimidazolesuccinocarboxamide synthase, partial [Magnetospirillaceae bacterium]|nr:phosphoribosylaminoimidazolesuccinocarboxamide synthase [Magnetospirillaceae bacterium]